MQVNGHVLLASHGTDGAMAAEKKLLELCGQETRIHHFVVVPDFWKGMTGDDWLNNGGTRNTFRRYVESELEGEIDAHCARLSREVEDRGLSYTREVVVGKPDACLIAASRNGTYDLIVMGSPRPKGMSGIKSRMMTDTLTTLLSSPLLIVPYPNE